MKRCAAGPDRRTARAASGVGRQSGIVAVVLAAAGLAAAGCQVPPPAVTPTTVLRVPGESIVLLRVQIPEEISGLRGAWRQGALRLTIQTEGGQAVRPTPVTPAGYLLASLPPGRYRIPGWEAQGDRSTAFGPLDLRFEVPEPDRLYYLGTLGLEPQTTERYRPRVTDEFEAAMRYLTAEHPHLAGSYERRLLSVPPPS